MSHQAQLEQLRSLPKPADSAGNRDASPAQRVLPTYPEQLKDKVDGDVTVSVRVSDQGEPLDVALVKSSGNDPLDRAGVANVRQWTFHPRLLRGKPVESRLTVTVRFRAVP